MTQSHTEVCGAPDLVTLARVARPLQSVGDRDELLAQAIGVVARRRFRRPTMNDLAKRIVDAHGGRERWKRFETLSAHLTQKGALWGLKGKAGVLDDTNVTVSLRREYASHAPFGDDDRRSSFTPDRVELLTAQGATIESLSAPRASFAGHTLETPWSDLQLAYFAGCAMWTYLNLPFLLTEAGVESWRIEPWNAGDETWERLRIRFPAHIATHSTEQTLYVGVDGLLKRHDYDVEIAGSTPGAHFISDYREVQGLMIPTRRRIFPRQPDGQAMSEPLVVSIDLDSISLL
jgi:hypothetical protein